MDQEQEICEELFSPREMFLMRSVHSAFKPPYVPDTEWQEALTAWLTDSEADGGIVVADVLSKQAGPA